MSDPGSFLSELDPAPVSNLEANPDALNDPGVYFLFYDTEIVYVGQSKASLSRVPSYAREGRKTFDRAAILSCEPRRSVESALIQHLTPRYNNPLSPEYQRAITLTEAERVSRVTGWPMLREVAACRAFRWSEYRARLREAKNHGWEPSEDFNS